jgi:hypothetical protein
LQVTEQEKRRAYKQYQPKIAIKESAVMINSQDGWISVLELFVTVVGVEFTVIVGTTVTVVGAKLVTVGVVWGVSLLTIVTGPKVNTVS